MAAGLGEMTTIGRSTDVVKQIYILLDTHVCTLIIIINEKQGLIQDYQLLILQEGKSDMFQYYSTILYVQLEILGR